jgi:hypothetical protein
VIGEVIMNRWAVVNGYWFLDTSPGRPPLPVPDWGSPGGIASIVQNGQFAVWQGSSLTDPAQKKLQAALDSDPSSKLCTDLGWAIGSAIAFLSSPTVNIWAYNRLVPLAFNSGQLGVPGYMEKIGSFGDLNLFYGAPVGDFSPVLIPLPPQLPRPRGHRHVAQGGPISVQ